MLQHVSDSVEKAQAMLLSVEGECQKMGLQLNANKTEVMTFNINEKAKITKKNGTIYSQSRRTSSTLDLTSARQRRPPGYGRPIHGEHSTTSRIFGTLPCLMTSKEQSSWPRCNPSCYMVQRYGHLLQCKKLGSMADTQVCSGWSSTLHGGIWSGMRSSMEIYIGSLQKSWREDFEWQDTVFDTLNWLQATSFYGNRRRDELHEAASLWFLSTSSCEILVSKQQQISEHVWWTVMFGVLSLPEETRPDDSIYIPSIVYEQREVEITLNY